MKGQLSASIPGAPGRQMPIGDPPSKAIPWLTTGALSEAWREELRELTARVEAFSPAETAKEEAATQEKAQRPQRVTQHSAETGRLIPPPSRATARHSSRQLHRKSAKTEGKQAALSCQDQELAVLELLCQILQTYSLMAVQQWLLTAGPREKDIAVGLLQTTTATLQLELQVLSTGTGDSAGSQASQSTAGISSGGQRSGRNQPDTPSDRSKNQFHRKRNQNSSRSIRPRRRSQGSQTLPTNGVTVLWEEPLSHQPLHLKCFILYIAQRAHATSCTVSASPRSSLLAFTSYAEMHRN
ncbi:protein TBATA isoform X2 [Struthio camelus]|uniref:protein TBATA isoform X2 n=1 Tax=Struthio camelus TaxID=8801 RepID=UPI0036042027